MPYRKALRRDKEALIRKCIAQESVGGESTSIEGVALERLVAYNWPANIRELRNAIRSALAICEDRIIRLGDLPTVIKRHQPPTGKPMKQGAHSNGVPGDEEVSLGAAERETLLRAIEMHHGHMTMVAAHLDISRNTLYRKIKHHGIKIARRPTDH
jgi:sigma-54 dependent transcriptional regulator, acetoin dehydrogenase operon transcriptional activator AcoR